MKSIVINIRKHLSLILCIVAVLLYIGKGGNYVFAQEASLTISLVADDDIGIGDALVLNSTGKVQKGDAANVSKLRFVGFAKDNASPGDTVLIDVAGLSNTQTNLDVGKTYYLSGASAFTETVQFGQETITGENGFSPAPASNNYERWGQTFTTDVSFTFSAVDFYLGKYGNLEDIQVSLYETLNGLPTGNAIWESDISSYHHKSPSWLKISADNTVVLAADKKYALVVLGGLKGGYWGESTSSTYADGNQVMWLYGLWQDYSQSGKDFVFKIYKREANTTPKKVVSILQSQETVTGENGFSRSPASNNYERWAQTFTTDSSASLAAIELLLGKYGGEEDINISLYETSNGLPTGTPFWASGITTYQHSSPTWLKINLSGSVDLQANTTYALVVLGEQKGGYWGESTSSTYAGGNQVMWLNGSWQDYSSSNKDFAFKIYKEEFATSQPANISIAPAANVVKVGLAVTSTAILISR